MCTVQIFDTLSVAYRASLLCDIPASCSEDGGFISLPTYREKWFLIFFSHSWQVEVLNKTASFLIPSASLSSNRPDSRSCSLICRQPREYKTNKWTNWNICHFSPGRGAASVSGGWVSTGLRKTDWKTYVYRVSHGRYGRRTSRPITVQELKRCFSGWNCDQTSGVVALNCGRFWEWFKTKCWKERKPPWRCCPSIKSNKQVINCLLCA